MPLALSILDQSPVLSGRTARDAISATIALARRADVLGYTRYWVAEHHAMRALANPAPEIMIARLAAETARIRIGSGGVLLPHYSAFKVAEQFRLLETLSPGRIDIGVGRAPGGSRLLGTALGSRDVEAFPQQVRDLIGFLDDSLPTQHELAALHAMPQGSAAPPIWILGSSDYGAALAAELGLPYAYAHFIGGDAPEITYRYQRNYMASGRCPQPRVILTLAAIVADTRTQAEELAAAMDLLRHRIARRIDLPIPSLAEARTYRYTPQERGEVVHNRRRLVVGDAPAARAQIERLADLHGADEVMILTITPDEASRVRSYELLAGAFEL